MSNDRVWDNDPTVKRWAQHVLEDMVPNVEASKVCLSLLPSEDDDLSVGDVKYWVEMGYMVCNDKPIMIVVMGNQIVPEKIAAVADEIVRLPAGVTPGSSQELAEAIQDFARRHPE